MEVFEGQVQIRTDDDKQRIVLLSNPAVIRIGGDGDGGDIFLMGGSVTSQDAVLKARVRIQGERADMALVPMERMEVAHSFELRRTATRNLASERVTSTANVQTFGSVGTIPTATYFCSKATSHTTRTLPERQFILMVRQGISR